MSAVKQAVEQIKGPLNVAVSDIGETAVYFAVEAKPEDADAIARLIASAPDLLRNLKQLALLVDHVAYEGSLSFAKEAIAKAEGRHE